MAKLIWLYKGEVMRMRRYGILLASLVVTIIWIITLQFSGVEEGINFLFPLLIAADASLMSLLLTGVTMTFESQESTLRSIQVTPVSSSEYLLAKTLGTVTSSLVTLVLLLIYGLLFKSLDINVLGISAAVVLVSFVFGQLGILMTYSAKDFTDLLMAMFKFMLVFIIPTVIELTGLLEAKWLTAWQYINPIQHTLVLLQAASITVDRSKLWSAICYLVILGGLLY
ncbi:MAG TPA: hypothetical protein DDZ53_03825, partial [Firmicutes bacterium]|nr:hypothetical protein [Bacillota bacterium]